MKGQPESRFSRGGLAEYFVTYRQVGWMTALGVLIWGWVAGQHIAQQEDPTIPNRHALVVTHFPGAVASKVEELVTKKLEKKISELESVEEVKSQSRGGVSVITVAQRAASRGKVDQEWDKLRAKLAEVALPEGARPPFLNTDYGNTVTLLFALTSPMVREAELIAKANLVRQIQAEIHRDAGSSNRATAVAFFPPAVAKSYRSVVLSRFENALHARRFGTDIRVKQGSSYILADFATTATRAELWGFIRDFMRNLAGTDAELHPDFEHPLLLMAGEDPLPQIKATAMPRYSYRELEIAAERFEDELKQLASVGKVTKIGTVPEMIYLLLATDSASGYPFTAEAVLDAIAARNAVIPGGALGTEGQDFPVQLSGEFQNEEDLMNPVIGLANPGRRGGLAPVYLRDLFEVRRMYENPIPYKVDVLTRAAPGSPLVPRRSVLVAVEMKEGQNITHFAGEIDRLIQGFNLRLSEGMQLLKISDQPSAVQLRLSHFRNCFVEAVAIVILVSLFLMEWRAALVVAAAIPLTVALTFAGMHLLGIPFHQISIAALIIALGMLVDDPVVASDAINRELHRGEPRDRAAWLGPVRLGRAILFGTLINILAFLPLTLLPGDKGAFIWGLPAVVTLALISSRLVSMTFVPLFGYYLLRGQKGLEEGGEVRPFLPFRWVDQLLLAILPRYRGWILWALDHPWRTVAVAYGLLLLSFGVTPFFGKQFFPPAERSQLLIDVELPSTTSLAQTRQSLDEVVQALRSQQAIVSAAIFSGGTAPRFYYNVTPKEPAPYLAQVLINTRSAKDVPQLLVDLRNQLDRRVAGARCVVKQLEQGPPVEEPIQVRVSGEDLDTLQRLASEVGQALRAAGGYQVHDDLGLRVPSLRIDIDQDRANTLGINNQQIGRLTQAAFAGIKVTELREGDHLIPVVIRLRVEERSEADKIRALYVQAHGARLVPLDSFAEVQVKPEYATIPHFGLLRAVTVKSYSHFGELPSAVLSRARAALQAIPLPPGYRLDLVGEAKELRESQQEMGLVMQVSLGLIALAMVVQFRSVSKSAVVMLTVPLGLIGAFAGIFCLRTSLGFMSLLGVVSLAGVIVSHIIVLSDFIEEARSEGVELREALVQAGLVRLRAVLVTVLATVGGLVPLTLTGGELWRPLTAVHIFGLLTATALTLIMLPVLYYLFCARLKWIR